MQLRASAKERTNLNAIEFEQTLWTARMRDIVSPKWMSSAGAFGPKAAGWRTSAVSGTMGAITFSTSRDV